MKTPTNQNWLEIVQKQTSFWVNTIVTFKRIQAEKIKKIEDLGQIIDLMEKRKWEGNLWRCLIYVCAVCSIENSHTRVHAVKWKRHNLKTYLGWLMKYQNISLMFSYILSMTHPISKHWHQKKKKKISPQKTKLICISGRTMMV